LAVTSILLIGAGWIAANFMAYNINNWYRILVYISVGVSLEILSLTKPFEWMLKKLDGVKI
jgi:hypothetical protein